MGVFPNWGRKAKLTIKASQVPTNLTNFTVMLTEVTLPKEMFDADGLYPALNGGGDIRFSSDEAGNSRLACDVNLFVTDNDPDNGKAVIWVMVPSISSTVDTEIWVWWNMYNVSQPGVGDPYGREAAWNDAGAGLSNWIFASHMHDDPNNQSIRDTTVNDNDGTKGAANQPNQVDSPINKQQNFNNSNPDYVQISGLMGSPSVGTLSAWVDCDSVDSSGGDIITLGDYLFMRVNASGYLEGIYRYATAWHVLLYTGLDLRGAGRKHIAFRCDPGSGLQKLYIDGVNVASATQTDAIVYSGLGSNTQIGRHGNGQTTFDYDGDIDEIRVSKVDRGEGYIQAEYNNQNSPSTFVNYGVPQGGEVDGLTGFARKAKITIDNTKVSGDLSNFPVLLKGNELPDEMLHGGWKFPARSDGGDIRASLNKDGTNRVPIEVVKFNRNETSDESEIWVLIPNLSSTKDTEFWLWWCKPTATMETEDATYGREAVWQTAFKAVYHMESSLIDSTSNDNDLTNHGTTEIDGKINKAREYIPGQSDYLDIVSNPSLNFGTGNFHISFWFKADDISSTRQIICKRTSGAGGNYEIQAIYNAGSPKLEVYIADSGGTESFQSSMTITAGTVYKVTLERSGSTVSLYINGSYDSGTTSSRNVDSTNPLNIGRDQHSGEYFDGFIDEVRLANTAFGSTWADVSEENQNNPSTFVSVGDPQMGWPELFHGWNRKCKLTIDKDKLSGDVAGFPVLFTLDNLPSEMFDADGSYPALNGGGDIRFSRDAAGYERLPCEIVTFVTNNNPALGEAEIWVKVPYISASADTDIYVWYNKAGQTQPPADDLYGSYNVWDDNYIAVHHMKGTTATIYDSTRNGNDGSKVAAGEPVEATGEIGKAQDFDGSNDRVNLGDIDITSQITISAIVKRDNDDDWDRIFGKSWTSETSPYSTYNLMVDDNDHFRMELSDGSTQYSVSGTTALGTTAFKHGHVTYDGLNLKVFYNGSQEGSSGHTGDIDSNNVETWIGASAYGGSPANFFDGIIDEARLSDIARSADWIKAEYESCMNPETFITEGTPESGDYPAFPSGWGRRCELTIQENKIPDTGGDLTDFPVLLTPDCLPSEMFDADGSYPALSGGGDIVITSDFLGANRLSVQVVKFIIENNPANGYAEIWVKVPTVDKDANTKLYIWYNKNNVGQPNVDASYGRNDVWSNGFKAVYHFEEKDPTGNAIGSIVDSSGNNNHGDPKNLDVGDWSESLGFIEHCIITDGVDEAVEIPHDSSLNPTSQLSISLWCYPDDWDGANNPRFVQKGNSDNQYRFLDNGTVIRFEISGLSASITGTEPSTGAWHHFFGSWDGSTIKLLIDKVKTSASASGTMGTTTDPLHIATKYIGAVSGDYLDGRFDEVRIASLGRADEWIEAEYNNQDDPGTFITDGTPVTPTESFTEHSVIRGAYRGILRGGVS